MFRMASRSVHINSCDTSSPLASCSINFFICEDSRSPEEDLDDQQMKEISRYIL
jgi:hypothetical protein